MVNCLLVLRSHLSSSSAVDTWLTISSTLVPLSTF